MGGYFGDSGSSGIATEHLSILDSVDAFHQRSVLGVFLFLFLFFLGSGWIK